jgi:hypothetical protein
VKSEPKKVYDLVSKETDEGKEVFTLIAEVKKRWKDDLREARIGAAWMIGRKADKDGRLQVGRPKKCSELERRLHRLDAIVLLNQDAWRRLLPPQRLALVHHELCHFAEALDSNGEVAYDGHGERKWRIVKHDIEEFREVVNAHGCYKAELAFFVKATIERDPQLSLYNQKEQAPDAPLLIPPAAATPAN